MSLDFVLFGSLYTWRRNALFFTVCWFDFSVFLLLILFESGTIQFNFSPLFSVGFRLWMCHGSSRRIWSNPPNVGISWLLELEIPVVLANWSYCTKYLYLLIRREFTIPHEIVPTSL